MAEPTLNTSTSASGRRQLASLLPATLKRLLAVAIGLAGFMLADTLYLLLVRLADRVGLDPFALDEATLPPFYQVLLLAHTGAGLLLAVLMAAFLIAHLPRVWRRFHHEAAWTGVPYAAVGVGGPGGPGGGPPGCGAIAPAGCGGCTAGRRCWRWPAMRRTGR